MLTIIAKQHSVRSSLATPTSCTGLADVDQKCVHILFIGLPQDAATL